MDIEEKGRSPTREKTFLQRGRGDAREGAPVPPEQRVQRKHHYTSQNRSFFYKSQIDFAFKTSSLDDVCDLLRLLIKKRGQPVKAQVEMVRTAMPFIDKIDDKRPKK
jgi:hypothetical protein